MAPIGPDAAAFCLTYGGWGYKRRLPRLRDMSLQWILLAMRVRTRIQ